MPKTRYIAVKENGITTIHMPDISGNYATLCGLDGDDPDPSVNQVPAHVPRGAKIDCWACKKIYLLSISYSKDEFDWENNTKGLCDE